MPDPEQSKPNDADTAKTVTLSEQDIRDAARLFRLLADPATPPNRLPASIPTEAGGGVAEAGRQPLIARARLVLDSRRIRKQYFRFDLFGEPAWEILLALYVMEEDAARLSISRLAEWIETPLTTVVRWVRTLEEESLIERVDHPTDRRTAFVRLRGKGRKALDTYLGLLPG